MVIGDEFLMIVGTAKPATLDVAKALAEAQLGNAHGRPAPHGSAAQSPSYRLKMTAPLWPPSPMLFESA